MHSAFTSIFSFSVFKNCLHCCCCCCCCQNLKVFTCCAPYPVDVFVRLSLRERGWVEKFGPRMLCLAVSGDTTDKELQCSSEEGNVFCGCGCSVSVITEITVIPSHPVTCTCFLCSCYLNSHFVMNTCNIECQGRIC